MTHFLKKYYCRNKQSMERESLFELDLFVPCNIHNDEYIINDGSCFVQMDG